MDDFLKLLKTLSEITENVPDVNRSSREDDLPTTEFPLSPSSSGYGSGSTSMNSSRRSSYREGDSSSAEFPLSPASSGYGSGSTSSNTSRRSSTTPARRDDMPYEALAIGAAVGLGAIGAYFFGKAVFGSTQPPTAQNECLTKLKDIIKDAEEYPVVGFDCQWVSGHFGRSEVALLQLASSNGNIALIQLHKMNIPHELKAFLSDRKIIKAGIATLVDARYLAEDYGLNVRATLDLRFLAREHGFDTRGLKTLAKDVLGRDIGREFELTVSDWEQDPLERPQVKYAEDAVKASLDIFKEFMSKKFWFPTNERIREHCEPFLEREFRSEWHN